jgi:hypothetical protein
MIGSLSTPRVARKDATIPSAMEITSLAIPPMPSKYYRRHAARLRDLAQDATTLAIREHLADVARQYDKLAEGAEAGYGLAEP